MVLLFYNFVYLFPILTMLLGFLKKEEYKPLVMLKKKITLVEDGKADVVQDHHHKYRDHSNGILL